MYRERLTITLDASLLTAVDSLIDGERLRNRSQTIEHLLKEGVGLHQLTQAFLFPTLDQDISPLIDLCAVTEIKTFYLCLNLASKPREAGYVTAINEGYARVKKSCEVIPVPADFGSGGSVTLKKLALTTPFLLVWPNQGSLPKSLIPAFLFHKSHHGTLTELCHRDSTTFASSGIYVASPELAAAIPAGASDLITDTFPALLKEDRVKGYFYSI